MLDLSWAPNSNGIGAPTFGGRKVRLSAAR